MEGIESVKDRRYKAYSRNFHPLVISLGGGVTERGWGVIKRICGRAADLSRPRLQWEPYQWAVRMLRDICAGMARVMGCIATRIPADAPDDCTVSVVDTGHGHGLALIRPGGGPAGGPAVDDAVASHVCCDDVCSPLDGQIGGTLMLLSAGTVRAVCEPV